MKIIIPTCDNYLKLIQANKWTMDKFGGKNLDVTVLGYKQPEFDMGSWKYISLGVDTGAQSFTSDIWNFFKDFDDEYFIYGSDDVVILDDINVEMIDEFKTIMDENEDVVKIGMTPYQKKNFKGEMFAPNLIQTRQDAEYRLSISYGAWRTSYFKRYFQMGLSPWQWELRDIAKNDGKIILGTVEKHVIDPGHIYLRGGILRPDWYKSENTNKRLSDEDIKKLTPIITL